jgi:hypothetical protein
MAHMNDCCKSATAADVSEPARVSSPHVSKGHAGTGRRGLAMRTVVDQTDRDFNPYWPLLTCGLLTRYAISSAAVTRPNIPAATAHAQGAESRPNEYSTHPKQSLIPQKSPAGAGLHSSNYPLSIFHYPLPSLRLGSRFPARHVLEHLGGEDVHFYAHGVEFEGSDLLVDLGREDVNSGGELALLLDEVLG